MSPEDIALCQQAIELANSGQTQAAYEQFCSIHNHGNPEDVTLLYWIAVTTPSREEAQRAIDTITRLEPDHPELHALQSYVARKEEVEKQRQRQDAEEEKKRREEAAAVWQHPILTCPYCHASTRAQPASKVTTAGWIIFAVLLISIIGIPFCWIGLLFRENYYRCGSCGILLGRV